jgi:hypothetical protein
MPLTQYWEGKLYITPTAASKVDVSAMIAATLGASGIVGIMGYSDDGEPMTLHRIEGSNPEVARARFKSGDLLEGCRMLFDPSDDENIPRGAQRAYAVVVNPLLQGSLGGNADWSELFPDINEGKIGDYSVKMTSRVYGSNANFLKRRITKSTTGVSVLFDYLGETEESPDLGTDVIMQLVKPASNSYTTMTHSVHRKSMMDFDKIKEADQVGAMLYYKNFVENMPSADTAFFAVLADLVDAALASGATWTDASSDLPDSVEILSASAADTNKQVIITGIADIDGTPTVVSRTVITHAINGTTAVRIKDDDDAEYTFLSICSVQKVDTFAGVLTVRTSGEAYGYSPTDIVTVLAVTETAGVYKTVMNATAKVDSQITDAAYALGAAVAGAVDIFDADTDKFGILEGVDVDGNATFSLFETDETDGIAQIDDHAMVRMVKVHHGSLGTFSMQHFVYMQHDKGGINTISKVIADYEGKTNMDADTSYGKAPAFYWADLDYYPCPLIGVTGSNIISATVNLRARTYALVDYCNSKSAYATAERKYGEAIALMASTAPFKSGWYYPATEALAAFTGASAGRSEARFTDWQAALDLFEQIRINTVVPLISDDDDMPTATAAETEANGGIPPDVSISAGAVFAAVKEHCKAMDGVSERNAYIGWIADTFDTLKDNAYALNSRHICMTSQRISRYNIEGVLTEFPEWSSACLAAGQQAGAVVGMPLTFKYVNQSGVTWENTDWAGTGWHPTYNSDELIERGVMFLVEVDGVGWRWAKHRTTYLKDGNDAFTQGAMNNAINYFIFTWREAVKNRFVGQMTLGGVTNRMEAYSATVLDSLKAQNVIVDGSVDGVAVNAWRNQKFWLEANAAYAQVEASVVNGIDFVFMTMFAMPVVMT